MGTGIDLTGRTCERARVPDACVTGNRVDDVRYGVVEAVNEFCVKRGWEFICLTCDSRRHLSFALRKTGAHGE